MNRIEELENEIRKHQYLYYNKTPEISDKEFDALWDELKSLDPNNKLFQVVGSDSSGSFQKAKHIINMSSQEKVNTEDDYIAWHERRLKDSGGVIEYKLDGISIELQYEEGFFKRGVTRGDGTIGDDISNNVRKMKGFVNEIGEEFAGAIRGEIVLYKSVFEEKYKPLGYANPRNMASGISKSKDGEGCENLSVIVYDAQESEGVSFVRESTVLDWLTACEFEVVPWRNIQDYTDVINFRNDVIQKRSALDYDIDGLVIKKNERNQEDRKRARPEYQIAFKFDSNTETTELVDIEWSLSGRIATPVAILSPIILDGTTVKRASLANPDEIRRLGVAIGDTVEVAKRGEIIPKIESVVSKKISEGILDIPREITFEGKQWEVRDEGARLVIVDEDFPLIKFHRLGKWIKKLNVKGFGPALLEDLFRKGFVNDISDFYTLDIEGFLETTNLKKAARKAFADLYNKSNEITVAQFISGFDIEGVGESVIDFGVDEGYTDLQSFFEANAGELANVSGIGDDRAQRIVEGLKEHKKEMEKVLATSKVTIKEKKENKTMGANGLNGLVFCFTGALESMTRDEAFELVTSKGGTIKSSLSRVVDYLVTNTPDSGSSKNRKADSLGISKITENEFLKMVATR